MCIRDRRGIKGPYYFGAEISCVDFFLCAHLDWRSAGVFDPLKAKYGVDALAPYPKISAIYQSYLATPARQSPSAKVPKMMGPMKDEILNSYND